MCIGDYLGDTHPLTPKDANSRSTSLGNQRKHADAERWGAREQLLCWKTHGGGVFTNREVHRRGASVRASTRRERIHSAGFRWGLCKHGRAAGNAKRH